MKVTSFIRQRWIPTLLAVLALGVFFLSQGAKAGSRTDSPSVIATLPPPRTISPNAKPPGERNPLIGGLAIASIVLTGAAGIYVYRIIRKGL